MSSEAGPIKRDFAIQMAEELWNKYVTTTEPDKRRIYGLRYCFWADIRDNFDMETEK